MSKDQSTPPINVDYFEDLTGEIKSGGGRTEDGSDAACEQIGQRIREMREEKGITVSSLARLTGFDEEMLAGIESGEVCPQLGTVIKLSKVLDSAFQQLISKEGLRPYVVTRQDDFKVISRSTSKRGQQAAYTYMSLAPEVKGRHMEPLIVDLEATPDQERSVHDGEEFIYVLEGQVILQINEERFELNPGDSAYYLSTSAHLLTAREGKARILAVITASSQGHAFTRPAHFFKAGLIRSGRPAYPLWQPTVPAAKRNVMDSKPSIPSRM